MKKVFFLIAILFSLFFLSQANPVSVSAQGNTTVNFKFIQPQGYGITSGIGPGAQAEGIVQTILVNVITIFFTVGGLGVVVYFVWGAVDWVLSGGDKEKISNARKKMTHAIIGLVLLSLSYVIINIVGQVAGFNPLGNLQLKGLGTIWDPSPNQ